jgi:lipopolysaccharide transport system permease protein
MKESIKELIQYRHLLLMLTWKDIRIRYKQSLMGFFWAILMPMLIVTAGVLVKGAFSMFSGQPLNLLDVASLSVKALPWAFFVGAVRFATNSLTSNANLVTKIYFPREVFPISAVLANLFDLAVASVVLVVILVVARTGASIHLLWLPVLLVLLILLTAGLGLFLSCGNLFFRDVKYLVEVFLTFGIFFTPVFYEAKMFGKWAPIILLNPLAPILEAMNRVIVLHRGPDLPWLAYSAGWAVFGFVIAWRIFDRAEYAFAESI